MKSALRIRHGIVAGMGTALALVVAVEWFRKYRPLISMFAALAAAVIAAVLLVPVSASAQDRGIEKNPYVADCKAQESTLAMAQKATRAIRLDLSGCSDLAGDDKSRCEKTIRDAHATALRSAQNAEKAAKRAIACCQKPGSKACGKKAAKTRQAGSG